MLPFMPNDYRISIYEVNYEALKEQGIKAVFFDIDNTILPYDKDEVSDRTRELFDHLKEIGLTVWILSNGKRERVERITSQLKIRGVWRAGKPFLFNFRKARRSNGFLPFECAVIGDQIFTDVWVANAEGALSILVRPISFKKDEKITRIKRPIERMMLKIMDLKPVRDPNRFISKNNMKK